MKITVFFLLLAVGTLTGCVTQEEMMILDDRLTTLEREKNQYRESLQSQLSTISQSTTEKEENLRTQSAGLRANLTQMRADIQALSGKIEEVEYHIRQDTDSLGESYRQREQRLADMEKTLTSLQGRVSALEKYLHMEKAPAKKKSVKSAGQSKSSLSSDQLYAQAKKELDTGAYSSARSKFQQFIKKYPTSKNADNAQFWIGESYYNEKSYKKAILEYQKVIDSYPKGNKLPAALLKQGYAFLNIGQKQNARIVWEGLIKKYPNSNEAGIAKRKLQGP
jgi:tol-pal system protein YbgF